MTVDEFAAAWVDSALVAVDVREAGEFAEGHVAGSVNIALGDLRERIDELPAGAPIGFLCRTGRRAAMATTAARRAGREAYYAVGGLNAWGEAGLALESGECRGCGHRTVTPADAWNDRARSLIVDVRSESAWLVSRIPHARSIPLAELVAVAPSLERAALPVIFVCRDGRQSAIAAELIGRRGRIPAADVAGGLLAWDAAGLPLERLR